jgi:hypothetical protein
VKKKTRRRGKITYEGLRPDTDPIYERGWTILTGRNLSCNLHRDKPDESDSNEETTDKSG